LGWAALVALGAAAVQWAGQRLEPTSLLWLAIGLIMLWFGLRPLMPRHYSLTGRGLNAVINVRAALSGAFFGAQAFLPLLFTEGRGLPLQWAAWTMTVGSAGWTLGAWLQSRSWLNLPRNVIITAGAASLTAGIGALALGAWLPGFPAVVLLAGWVLAGLGMGLATASTSLGVMQLSQTAELGRNTSSLQVGEALGNSLGAGLAGTLYLLGGGVLGAAFVFAPLLTAMVLVAGAGVLASRRIGHLDNHSTS
ncbi:MAG: MFS transporter, partial [Propionicimonas sp.]